MCDDTGTGKVRLYSPKPTVTVFRGTDVVQAKNVDAVDDPAIWRGIADPQVSLIVAIYTRAGLNVHDLPGR